MLLAKVATMTRPSSGSMISRKASPTVRSDGRVARVLGAGRVGQQADDALLAEPGEDREVGQLAVDRRVVELEVAGVDDRADRRPQGDAHRVRDRVADPERDDVERADVELVARVEREERVVVELVLLDLVAEQAAGQRGGVDRHARELGEHVRQARRRGPRGHG